MKTVGIRELKTNLSKYIHLVKFGERVIVKDRNEVVAELRKPSDYINDSNSSFDLLMDEEVAIGSLIRAEVKQSILLNIKQEAKSSTKGLKDWKIIHRETKKRK